MTEEATPVEEVVEAPKKKRGRPKGSKNKKKAKAETPVAEVVEADGNVAEPPAPSAELAALEQIATTLGNLSSRMDTMEAAAANAPQDFIARGPNSPTTNQRANQELGHVAPGPARQRKTDGEVNKERRDAIYEARQARGRVDRQVMPSGVVASVGNKQRRNQGANRVSNQPQ